MSEIREMIARALCKGREYAFCSDHCKDGCRASHETLEDNGSYRQADAALAALDQLTDKGANDPSLNGGAEKKDMQICAGCGSTEMIEEIRAKNPDAVSCCPERKMIPARDIWRRMVRAEAENMWLRDHLQAMIESDWTLPSSFKDAARAAIRTNILNPNTQNPSTVTNRAFTMVMDD